VTSTRGRLWLLVLLGGVTAAAFSFGRRLDAVQVRGLSMAPTLRPGDRLIIRRDARPPTVGDLVIARDPREPERELIKRVTAIADGGVELRGDNPGASTDGRTFGPVPPEALAWRVMFRYWPLDRFGRPEPLPAVDLV
jgi:nickel-type superoxide dismutase maturation protease